MTIYYAKQDSLSIRKELELAYNNDEAKKNQFERHIKENLSEATQRLVFNSDKPNPLVSDNEWPKNQLSFFDYGICPMGQANCAEGGEIPDNLSSKVKSVPVPHGYLGVFQLFTMPFFHN